MDKLPDEIKNKLLGETIDEWRCPKCGALSYTQKAQQAVLVKCSSCPGLVWMQHVNAAPEANVS